MFVEGVAVVAVEFTSVPLVVEGEVGC